MNLFNWAKSYFKEDKAQKAISLLTKAAKNGDKRAKKLISLYDSIEKQESTSSIKTIINSQSNQLAKIINNKK